MSTPPKTLTVTESNKLLDALCPGYGTAGQKHQGLRNYCIGLLMLDAGLRVGEVVRLRIADLLFNSGPRTSIIILAEIAKNNEERIIPLSTRLSKALTLLDRYLWTPNHRPVLTFAFSNRKGTHAITTRQVERIINAGAMESLGRPVHPHILRHTFASRLMRTTNARIVQQLLGHKHMSSTQIYTHPNQRDLTDAIEAMEKNDCKDAGTLHDFLPSPSLPDSAKTLRTDKDVS